MSFRKTGIFQPGQEVLVLTCDVCERDIGYEDGRRARPHLSVARHPNAGTLDDQQPEVILCSRECLRAYAESLPGPLREDSTASRGASPRVPRR